LIDEVKRLGEAQQRQELSTQRLETRVDLLAEHSREMSRRIDGVERQMGVLTEQMGVLTEQMAVLTEQMAVLTEQMDVVRQQMSVTTGQFGGVLSVVNAFSDEVTGLRTDLTALSEAQADFGSGLKRISAILVKALGATEDRFDELEQRVARLEKKSA
jgi:chromosome segregation ATPase